MKISQVKYPELGHYPSDMLRGCFSVRTAQDEGEVRVQIDYTRRRR